MKLKYIMLRVGLFLVYTIVILGILEFVTSDDVSGSIRAHSRIMIHELYNGKDNIDVLFLGSSHTYHSINPVVVDESTNYNSFNAGSSSQTMDTSLVLLKETIKNNDITDVYLEMYFGVIDVVSYDKRTKMVKHYIVADYMPMSKNKVEYLLSASNSEQWINSFSPAKREINFLWDAEYIISLLKEKLTDEYLNYRYDIEAKGGYAGKGFWRGDGSVEPGILQNIELIKFREPSQDYKDSLLGIVTLCKEKEIQLTLFVTPMPTQLLEQCEGGYDLYVDMLDEWSEEYGIEYYDFNLCKEEVLDLRMDEFRDTNHLNGMGADKFTEVLCKLMYHSSDIEVEDAFYKSYEEKALQGEVTR